MPELPVSLISAKKLSPQLQLKQPNIRNQVKPNLYIKRGRPQNSARSRPKSPPSLNGRERGRERGRDRSRLPRPRSVVRFGHVCNRCQLQCCERLCPGQGQGRIVVRRRARSEGRAEVDLKNLGRDLNDNNVDIEGIRLIYSKFEYAVPQYRECCDVVRPRKVVAVPRSRSKSRLKGVQTVWPGKEGIWLPV